ncbi:helix-turn-helix transcriptional regulator [Mesorhizobium sp.]|uniref:helix-turn-helix transcriptional regulator n=1 Tax=Mesorhizobium sp. TaxID=1871066 RepID=UPI0025E39B67|nr:helix-turn-helix transcriptional regulator [Mesorhizobium sp.]
MHIAIKHSADYKASMITGAQIRAARALLGWTTQRLADASGVHYATLSRAEQSDGIPNMRAQTLASVQMTLEKAGCQFMDGTYSGEGGPGVRLR